MQIPSAGRTARALQAGATFISKLYPKRAFVKGDFTQKMKSPNKLEFTDGYTFSHIRFSCFYLHDFPFFDYNSTILLTEANNLLHQVRAAYFHPWRKDQNSNLLFSW